MIPEREPAMLALFALASQVRWSGQQFLYMDRRIRTPDQIGSDQQPACLQGEYNETFVQVARLPYKRILSASWVIYHKPPPTGGASANNAIMDAVQWVFRADDPSGTCTLGGLVYHAHIDGEVFKDPGDLDDQGMLIVPIKLLLP